jgi:hypothetical protein
MSTLILQPQIGPFALDPAWVKKGLQLVLLRSGYLTPAGFFRYTVTGSVSKSLTPNGDANGFGTAEAGNTNSYLSGPVLAAPLSGFRSIFTRVYARGTGGGALGRVFQDVSGLGQTAGCDALYMSSGRLSYNAVNSTQGSAAQSAPVASLPLNQWVNQSLTHDRTASFGS